MLSTYKKVLFSMIPVYLAYKKNLVIDKENEYSTLLIDKFASHSSSFYHITNGFIESVHSTTDSRLMGFDVFTFNSTFRAIIETYVAFHGLFIVSKSEEERRARFLLWKMEGLTSKVQLEFEEDVVSTESDKKKIQLMEDEFEKSIFYQSFDIKEMNKIYKRGKTHNWKFVVVEKEIKECGRLKFSRILTQSKTISNLYNLSSMHVHSSFYAIEQFKNVRGKIIDDKYVNSYVIQAMYLTASLIIDLKNSNAECSKAYKLMETEVQDIIQTTYRELRENDLELYQFSTIMKELIIMISEQNPERSVARDDDRSY